MIGGADGWADVDNIGISKMLWLKTDLEMPEGIPLHATFRELFFMEIGCSYEG